MLCDDREGWRGRVDGREAQEEGDVCIRSVQFSHSVVSDSLQPHGL